jgi:hypothetical protein
MTVEQVEIPESQWDVCDPLATAIKALVRAQNGLAAEHAKYSENGNADYERAFAVRWQALGQLLSAAGASIVYEAAYI